MNLRCLDGRLVAIGALALTLALASATPAATPAPRTVTITQSGPVPNTATVVVGASVRWVDATQRHHFVIADGNAFPAFSLAAGGSHTLRFDHTGRFRYRLDGRQPGTVVVISGGAGSTTKAAAPCSTLCTYHYSVSVKGIRKYQQTFDASSGAAGIFTIGLQWTAQFPTVTATALQDHGRPTVTGGGRRTNAQAAVQFSETRNVQGGPCSGTATARAPVDLGFSDGGGSPLVLDLQPFNNAQSLDNAVNKAQRAACAGYGINSISLGAAGSHGTKWSFSTTDYLRVVVNSTSAAASHFPVDRLTRGEGFTLEAEALGLTSDCGSGCSEHDSLHYTITFTPRSK